MSAEMGRTAFRIAVFIVLVAVVLLLVVDRGSAEFYLTAITLILGLVFMLLVWLLARRLGK